MTNFDGNIPPNYSEFMKNKLYSKYNPLDKEREREREI